MLLVVSPDDHEYEYPPLPPEPAAVNVTELPRTMLLTPLMLTRSVEYENVTVCVSVACVPALSVTVTVAVRLPAFDRVTVADEPLPDTPEPDHEYVYGAIPPDTLAVNDTLAPGNALLLPEIVTRSVAALSVAVAPPDTVPVPTEFTAATVNVYDPGLNAGVVYVVPVPVSVYVPDDCPVRYTTYPVIAEPPLFVGAVHDNDTRFVLWFAVAVNPVGASGVPSCVWFPCATCAAPGPTSPRAFRFA